MEIDELLEDLKVEFLRSGHHHCREGWVQLKSCPFCGSANYHLGFNLAQKFFSCWKCGWHGGQQTLEELGADKQEVRTLYKQVRREHGVTQHVRRGLKEPKGKEPLKRPHKDYLIERGFDPDEMVKLWDVEGISIHSRLSWRIYIPIIQNTVRVSWTTRAIGNVSQRYLSASAKEEAMNHKHCVYGLDYCAHSAIICEGPLDAWNIGPGAVALFGTAFTTAQVNKLSRVPYRFVCFDRSREAQQQAQELASQLSCFPGHTCNVQLDADDPGTASRTEVRLLRKTARLSR